MADTHIEWTEKSWNPVVGCSIASPGCTNCYAMKMAYRLESMAAKPDGSGNIGLSHYIGTTQNSRNGAVWTGKLAFSEKALIEPLKRKKPTTYFVNSMGDLFHEDCPDEWIDRVFAVMALCPQHTFQVLTKRSERMRQYLSTAETPLRIARFVLGQTSKWEIHGERALAPLGDRAEEHEAEFVALPLPNVWLGVSVEDQRRADERIPDLLQTPAAVRWLSCEPLLGAVDLRWIPETSDEKDGAIDALLGCNWLDDGRGEEFQPVRPGHEGRTMHRWVCSGEADILSNQKIDWVVCGGESGSKSRPMHPDWARALRDQCADADVPYFFKQHGDWLERKFFGGSEGAQNIEGSWLVDADGMIRLKTDGVRAEEGYPMQRVGKRCAGRVLDGVTHDGMPPRAFTSLETAA